MWEHCGSGGCGPVPCQDWYHHHLRECTQPQGKSVGVEKDCHCVGLELMLCSVMVDNLQWLFVNH